MMIVDRLTFSLVCALALGGCALPSSSPDFVGRYPGSETIADADVTPDAALARLPASAGAVVAVRQTGFSNGVRQEIVLDGPGAMMGENKITVEALLPTGIGDRRPPGGELKLAPPTATEIDSELAKVFPGVSLQISGDLERTAQGPFGYASGKNGELNCLYAWQYLAPQRPLTLLEGASGTGRYPVSARVRLCRAEPVATLLADVHRLVITSPNTSRFMLSRTVAPLPAAGDALEAAVGPLEQVPVDDAVDKPMARRLPHHAGRAARYTPRRRGSTPRSRPEAVIGRSAVPPVPLPGDVVPTVVAAPPVVTRPSPAAGDQDALPLPK